MRTLHHRGHLTELRFEDLSSIQRDSILKEARVRSRLNIEHLRSKTALNASDSPIPPTSGYCEGVPRSAIVSEMRRQARSLIPGASAFLMHEGRLLIATMSQMDGFDTLPEININLRRTFLYEVMSWFIDNGLTASNNVVPIAEKFEILCARK